ncbi:ferritin-like domain-containing protein [Trametes polyzona]|nr:ferritin-like domain-containing protein [Trametes polyzona]
MFAKAALLAFIAASTVLGAPTPSGPSDVDVLNFALTLEHLENTFYAQGLSKFSPHDFEKAGYPPWVRARFVQIFDHEAEHVKFLTGALGDKAVQACEYNFPLDSPSSFVGTSMVLETVGASAYLGAAKYLGGNADYLTAAGSILSVEARQASWVASSVMKLQPWNGPFDIPLTPSGAYSLAVPFIKSCPSTNAPLPVKSFPALKLSSSSPAHGAQVVATYSPSGQTQSGQEYVAWLDGLQVVYTPLGKDGKTNVPDGLMGTVYAAVVSSQETPSDSNMLSGFAAVQFPFNSQAKTNA